jgi:1A family penicillin-binding protein
MKIFLKLLKFIGVITVLAILIIIAVFMFFAKDLPSPEELLQQGPAQSTKIYDRTGQVLLYEIHGIEKRTIVKLEDISPYFRNAIIAVEDAGFYRHWGIEFKSIIRTIFNNLFSVKFSEIGTGASTITQQLIKNAILSNERTFIRKIKEIILALELERKYSKDKILEFYVNQIPFGSNAYGIEAAAQTFFNKTAKDLTLAQSAMLAALPKAPTFYSPYGSNSDKLKQRQEYILDRMVKLGFITNNEAQQAKNEKLTLAPPKTDIKAPHFVMFIKQKLEDKYGKDSIEKGGLKVITTLDYKLQSKAEEIVKEKVAQNAKKYNARNAAAIVIDPKNGQILSMVGSADYFNSQEDGNVNVTIRPRQPGSAFKPIVYAEAFNLGYTPNTILFDVKTEFKTKAGQIYIPENYDRKYRGPITMKSALAQSLNIPAVKTLYLVGVERAIDAAIKAGIKSIERNRQNLDLALVLGGGEVTLLELTSAYGIFANDGVKMPVSYILEISDAQGKILEKYEPQEGQQIYKPQIARQISDILSDNEARAPMFGLNSPLFIKNFDVAVKTGTTDLYKDGWTIGYTKNIVVGVWAGNNNNESMKKEPGVVVAAPIWHDIITYYLSDKQNDPFIKPEDIKTGKDMLDGHFPNEKIVKINKITGKLADANTPPELVEQRIYKEAHTILHYVKKDDPLGPIPQPNERDPAYNQWEGAVQQWIGIQPDFYLYNQTPPTQDDNENIITDQKPQVQITNLNDNQIVNDNVITIQVSASSPAGIKQVDFFVDGVFLGSDFNEPFSMDYSFSTEKEYVISAKAYDNNLISAETNKKIIYRENPSENISAEILQTSYSSGFPKNFNVTLTQGSAKKLSEISIYYSTDVSLSSAKLIKNIVIDNLNQNQQSFEIIWEQSPGANPPYYVFALLKNQKGDLIKTNALVVY